MFNFLVPSELLKNQFAYLGWSASVLHSTRAFNVLLECSFIVNFPAFSFFFSYKTIKSFLILATCLYLQATANNTFCLRRFTPKMVRFSNSNQIKAEWKTGGGCRDPTITHKWSLGAAKVERFSYLKKKEKKKNLFK